MMRYKIVEKASGEVIVLREIISTERQPDGKSWSQWIRLPVMFLRWEDAKRHVDGLREVAKLDEIKREEIIHV